MDSLASSQPQHSSSQTRFKQKRNPTPAQAFAKLLDQHMKNDDTRRKAYGNGGLFRAINKRLRGVSLPDGMRDNHGKISVKTAMSALPAIVDALEKFDVTHTHRQRRLEALG